VTIDIANESSVDVDEVAIASVARYVLDELRIHPLAELSVLLVDEAAMTELHERWMGEPGPTDVLSFPMDELRPPSPVGAQAGPGDEPGTEPGLLGDVVLCPQVAADQAAKAGHPAQQELELLTVHGILHLLGYDHAEPAEHAEMFGLQDKLLSSWRAGGGDTRLCPDGCWSSRPCSWGSPHGPPGRRRHSPGSYSSGLISAGSAWTCQSQSASLWKIPRAM
jgi:probable rRNA maturation factor